MRRFNSITLIILTLLFASSLSYAQNQTTNNLSISIPEVALLSLKSASSGNIFIYPQAPAEAGLSIDLGSSQTGEVWVNYSSVAKSTSQMFRHLDVAMDGALPNGLILKLVASADAGYGNGRLGVPTGEITLSGNQQEIITSIGSCYTGNGAGKGHKLTYNLASGGEDSYQNIPAGEVIVKIVFTLSDEG